MIASGTRAGISYGECVLQYAEQHVGQPGRGAVW